MKGRSPCHEGHCRMSQFNQRENRIIGAVGQESSGSTQAHDANFQNFSNDLTAYSVSSTSQNASNGPSGVPSWQNEWNCLAPGTQMDKIVEAYQYSIPQENQPNGRWSPSVGLSDKLHPPTISKNNFIVCPEFNYNNIVILSISTYQDYSLRKY